MKLRQETKRSKKLHIAFAVAAAIGLLTVHQYSFSGQDKYSKFRDVLNEKGVQYVITDGEVYLIDKSDPNEVCALAKKYNVKIKSVFNSQTVQKANCK